MLPAFKTFRSLSWILVISTTAEGATYQHLHTVIAGEFSSAYIEIYREALSNPSADGGQSYNRVYDRTHCDSYEWPLYKPIIQSPMGQTARPRSQI